MSKINAILVIVSVLTFCFFVSCNKKDSSTTYSCTCHYYDPSKSKDTSYITTYPLNTDKSIAQTKCDSTLVNVIKVIDTAGTCSL